MTNFRSKIRFSIKISSFDQKFHLRSKIRFTIKNLILTGTFFYLKRFSLNGKDRLVINTPLRLRHGNQSYAAKFACFLSANIIFFESRKYNLENEIRIIFVNCKWRIGQYHVQNAQF